MQLEIQKYLFDIQTSIDNETVWSIVINHLPKLKEEVVSLLEPTTGNE